MTGKIFSKIPVTAPHDSILNHPRPLFERLGGRPRLAILIRNFYSSLRIHPVLGPIFAAHVADWPAHFARLTDFWAVQAGAPATVARYRGKLLHTHQPLDLRREHFDLWLAQWRQSCRLHFPEPEAGELIALAERLARRMEPAVTD
ncbi:MAG: group III truncated hemoglobin [Verrucomicrobia bacterium]|nr:group III truncated hemoglobin [Verrucomicrobiota bacterium]